MARRERRRTLGRSELRGSVSEEGSRSARLDRERRRIPRFRACARVGVVESCWLSDRQDVQADSALGLLEEIEQRSCNTSRGIRRIAFVVV
jgi:hypothetical protein